MKARLLAIVAALAAAGGGIYFVNWNDESQMRHAVEIVSFDSCSTSACNTASCLAANRHLADAGTGCTVRTAECDARRVDGGSRYWRVEVTAMRCPRPGGGFNWAVALDDAGTPMDAVVSKTFPCAWKPNAGATCTRLDGGNPGVQNTMQPGQWTGAGCVRKACVEIAGDSSAP